MDCGCCMVVGVYGVCGWVVVCVELMFVDGGVCVDCVEVV